MPTTGHKSTACVTCWGPPRRTHRTGRLGRSRSTCAPAAHGSPPLSHRACVTVLPVNLPDSACISICFYFYALNFSLAKALIFLLLLVPYLGFFFIRLPKSASHFFSFGALRSRFQRRVLLVCCRTWASKRQAGSPQAPSTPAPRGCPDSQLPRAWAFIS